MHPIVTVLYDTALHARKFQVVWIRRDVLWVMYSSRISLYDISLGIFWVFFLLLHSSFLLPFRFFIALVPVFLIFTMFLYCCNFLVVLQCISYCNNFSTWDSSFFHNHDFNCWKCLPTTKSALFITWIPLFISMNSFIYYCW